MSTKRLRRILSPVIGPALVLMLIALAPLSTNAANTGMVERTAKGSFESVTTALKKALTANKLVIVKEVPFKQMLAMVGVKAEKMKSFEIFHPRFGKIIYSADKAAFVEAPLRIFIRDKGGEVLIQYKKPSVIFAGYSGLSGLGKDLDKVFERIVGSVAK